MYSSEMKKKIPALNFFLLLVFAVIE